MKGITFESSNKQKLIKMYNLVRTQVHISELKQGMTVEFNGELLTVSRHDIKRCDLFGYSFRGDASKQILTRVEFAVPTVNGIVLR